MDPSVLEPGSERGQDAGAVCRDIYKAHKTTQSKQSASCAAWVGGLNAYQCVYTICIDLFRGPTFAKNEQVQFELHMAVLPASTAICTNLLHVFS